MEPAPINPALKRKVQKAISTNVNDPNLLLALRNLSTFYTHNSQQSRWNLRDQLENKSLEVNEEILDAFQTIDVELESLKGEIDEMTLSCERMQSRLDEVKVASGVAIQQAEALFHAEEATQVQLAVAQTFLAKFTLTPAQVRAIKNAEVNSEFFEALRRLHRISHDCRTLLVGETQLQQRTGVEIAEAMNENLEVAYRKLYRWVRSETRFLEIYNDPEVPGLMVQAFEALQERPVLLAYCLDEIAATRAKTLVRGFLDALTVGGPHGVPRPIDVHAHDPKRYVGDMAAWIHVALASELELLSTGLLRKVHPSAFLAIRDTQPTPDPQSTSGTSSNPSAISATTSADGISGAPGLSGSQSLSSSTGALSPGHSLLHPNQHLITPEEQSYKEVMARLLDRELAGLCKPFLSRVENVFASNASPSVIYHLANLFYYYSHTLSVHLDARSAIQRTFADCRDLAYKAFFRTLGSRMAFLQGRPPIPAHDLSPTHEFTEVVLMTQDILKILETSIIPSEEKEYESIPILDRIVDPLLEACSMGLHAANSTLKPGPRGMPVQGNASTIDLTIHTMEQVVYLINCHSSICKVLEKYPFCQVKLGQLRSKIESEVTGLVSEQAAVSLRQCGLAPKLAALHQYESLKSQNVPNTPATLALVPGMDATSMQTALRSFESSILEMGALSMVQIDKIEDDRVRSRARSSTSSMLADAYTTLYNAVSSVDSGYTSPEALLRYKPEQVRIMIAT